jgi:hypothetical protein
MDESIKPKDIDIFVTDEDELTFNLKLLKLGESERFGRLSIMDPETAGYTIERLTDIKGNDIICVGDGGFSLVRGQAIKINIIVKTFKEMTIDRLIDSFDHSLCQCWVNPDTMQVDSVGNFKQTLISKKVLLLRKEMQGRTLERLQALAQRHKAYDAFSWEGKNKTYNNEFYLVPSSDVDRYSKLYEGLLNAGYQLTEYISDRQVYRMEKPKAKRTVDHLITDFARIYADAPIARFNDVQFVNNAAAQWVVNNRGGFDFEPIPHHDERLRDNF